MLRSKCSFAGNVRQAFTMMEMMVALLLLAVGMLGFSAMSVVMIKAGRTANKSNEAATLVQDTAEGMSGVVWGGLGADTALPAPNGLAGGVARTEGPVNRNGQPEGTGQGPYSYYRHVVICSETDTVAAGANPQPCAQEITADTRPSQLQCAGLNLSPREKMIRILVSWRDREGQCRFKNVDSLSFQ